MKINISDLTDNICKVVCTISLVTYVYYVRKDVLAKNSYLDKYKKSKKESKITSEENTKTI